jgi:hypothetical protein
VSKCPKLNKLVITRKPGRDPEHDSYGWWADDQENPGYLTECVLIDDNVKITTSEGVF